MQRYTDKAYKGQSKKNNSPLLESLKESSQSDNSFSLISSQILKSIQNSRVLPLTFNKQKCKNCCRFQHSMNELISELLAIQKNISEKEEKLGQILAEKVETISQLQTKLQAINDKTNANHLTSTFFTETGNKLASNTTHLQSIQKPPNKQLISEVNIRPKDKHTYVSLYNMDISVGNNRQKQNQSTLNQNISPNCQKSVKDKMLNKLQFQNNILKDYNRSLLNQLQKSKVRVKKEMYSFL